MLAKFFNRASQQGIRHITEKKMLTTRQQLTTFVTWLTTVGGTYLIESANEEGKRSPRPQPNPTTRRP